MTMWKWMKIAGMKEDYLSKPWVQRAGRPDGSMVSMLIDWAGQLVERVDWQVIE